MIIHYEITWTNDLKEKGQLPVKSFYGSIVDLSCLPRQRYKEAELDLIVGTYPWYNYCGKITKVQMEA